MIGTIIEELYDSRKINTVGGSINNIVGIINMALNFFKNKFTYSTGQNNNGITFVDQHEIYGFTRFSYRNEQAISLQTRRHFFLNIFYTLPLLLLKRTTILRCVLNNKDAIIFISRPTRRKKK